MVKLSVPSCFDEDGGERQRQSCPLPIVYFIFFFCKGLCMTQEVYIHPFAQCLRLHVVQLISGVSPDWHLPCNLMHGDNSRNATTTTTGIQTPFPPRDIAFWAVKQFVQPRQVWSRSRIDRPAGQPCPWKATLTSLRELISSAACLRSLSQTN